MIDNLDRVRILAVSVEIFGLATVGGAWAGNFLHLLLLRTFVGERHFNGRDEINGRLKMPASPLGEPFSHRGNEGARALMRRYARKRVSRSGLSLCRGD